MDKEEKRSVLLCYVGRRRFDSLFIRKKKIKKDREREAIIV